jgi:hypothetical protein
MKIISIISENKEINEGPIRNVMPAFTKTQKLRKLAKWLGPKWLSQLPNQQYHPKTTGDLPSTCLKVKERE